jgi:MFS transporter, PAT family, beta-lactamase induction signal transducer AmpG
VSKEPLAAQRRDAIEREERVVSWLKQRSHWPQSLQTAGSWFMAAVVCPLLDFFGRYGWGLATVVVLFMCSYRLTDFTMGSMTNSFYIDKGYTLTQIATVVKFYGLAMSIVGVILAGIVITKFGTLRSLILGSVMVMLSNLGFSTLAAVDGTTLLGLGLVNGFDNLALAMHGTALITFLSSLTSPRYTATQYALFSSLYALPAKILEGFSGFVVEAIGYQMFFIYTASLSIPALILLYWVDKRGVIKAPVPATAPA